MKVNNKTKKEYSLFGDCSRVKYQVRKNKLPTIVV